MARTSLFSGITVMSIIIRAGVIFPLCPSGVGGSQLRAPKERSDAHISQLDLAKGVVSPVRLWGHSRCVAAAVAPCSGPAFAVALGSTASTEGVCSGRSHLSTASVLVQIPEEVCFPGGWGRGQEPRQNETRPRAPRGPGVCAQCVHNPPSRSTSPRTTPAHAQAQSRPCTRVCLHTQQRCTPLVHSELTRSWQDEFGDKQS